MTIAALEAAAPGRPVVRAMPNTPATIGLGAAAIAAGTHANDGHLDLAEQLLGALGLVVRLPEHLLDAVTGLSGSGPAYLFLVAEALVEAGVLVGLPRPVATQLVNQTLLGASTLLAQGDEGPEALRAAVTSPGGTTAGGPALARGGRRSQRVHRRGRRRDPAFDRARRPPAPKSREASHPGHSRQHWPPRRMVRSAVGVGRICVAQGLSKARFLTVQEVADLMRVSSMTVYRLIKAGDLPAVRVGRSFRVSELDVDTYLASRYTQAG